MQSGAIDALKRTPLFSDLDDAEIGKVAALFKIRRLPKGETVVKEGLGGAAFFVIESGEADVMISGRRHTSLKSGDFFGEVALFDEGSRTATIVAATDLVCYGLTYWDFRPLVEANGVIGWKLLQRMSHLLRDSRREAD